MMKLMREGVEDVFSGGFDDPAHTRDRGPGVRLDLAIDVGDSLLLVGMHFASSSPSRPPVSTRVSWSICRTIGP